MIEKKRVITIELTADEVKKAIENHIKSQDPDIVFPADYFVKLATTVDNEPLSLGFYPSFSTTLEIPEPRKVGYPKGKPRKKKEEVGIVIDTGGQA